MAKLYSFSDLIIRTDKIRGIKTDRYYDHGKFPIIDQGIKFISGYTDDVDSLYKDSLPVVVFGDHTLALKYVDFPFCAGADGTQILKPNEKIIIGKFLYYSILNLNIQSLGYSRHFKILKEASFNVPPLEDQKQIVKILDEADALRQKRQQAIGLLDDYLKSVFLQMFGDPVKNRKGWEKQKFEKLGTLDRGISKNRPRNAPELLGGDHPLIQTGDVANADIYIEKYTSTYSDLGLKQSKKWPKGTLCITIAANIAKTGILSFDACFPDSVVGFIANTQKTNNEFIHFWMSFLQKILERNAPESAQKNINLRILRDLDVINPPMNQQNKFSEIVIKTETVKQKMLAQSEELENQFQALMQKAFNGQL